MSIPSSSGGVRSGLFSRSVVVISVLIFLSGLAGPAAVASPGAGPVAGDRYVAETGDDTANDCLVPDAPCLTIQHAIDVAVGGDEILIAQGTYEENLVIAKQLALRGGFEAQTWTRDIDRYVTFVDGSASQPVPGDWDGRLVAKAAVIRDDTLFKMWFDGINLFGEAQVGLATSANGTTWNKSAANPVLSGTPGTWDDLAHERAPFVLKEGGLFKMWYESGEPRQLGYATSSNGVTWTKYAGNPVLQPGPDGFDQGFTGHGAVLHEGIYKLWYHAQGDQGLIIAYATSPDGVNWTKQGPVLVPEAGNWDENAIWGPSVLRYNGQYWMWYSGAGSQGLPAIGVATSFDGVTWTRVGSAPVLSGDHVVADPHVLLHGSTFKMWYQNPQAGTIEYAESADGIHWTPSPANPVLTPGDLGQWGEPVVRFEDGSDGSLLDGLDISGGQGGYAGGVDAFSADVTIQRCRIHDNFAGSGSMGNAAEGGGVLGAGDGKTLTIQDSILANNDSQSGASAVRAHMGTLAMVNVLVAGNHSPEAPALHLNGPATLTNVTIAGNDGGILHNPPVEQLLAVRNSIVWGNGWAINEGPAALTQVRSSDIEGGWLGAGNIDVPPVFRDPDEGDFHLWPSSPCVDAGNNAWSPNRDLEGHPRPLDGNYDGVKVVDMGADEYLPLPVYLPLMTMQ